MTDPFLLIGIAGMLMILIGFLLINMHKLTADSTWYDVLNFAGSGLLVISALATRAWPFVILNAVFALYSLRDLLVVDLQRTHKLLRKA